MHAHASWKGDVCCLKHSSVVAEFILSHHQGTPKCPEYPVHTIYISANYGHSTFHHISAVWKCKFAHPLRVLGCELNPVN